MGWLFPCCASRKDLIEDLVRSRENESSVTSTCLAHCFRGNSFSGVLWSVWERRFIENDKEIKPTERWIVCDLLRYNKNYESWGYKSMEEVMHPYYYSCPLKYLDLVPFEKYGGNAEWRDAVVAHHQKKRKPKVKL